MRILVILALASAPLFGAALQPYGLETEARRNPAGVDSARPRLSWKLKSAEPGQRQTAYEIQVGDVWDSGRVDSEETSWIPYSGPALHSFQRCTWKVRVWNAAGEASGWSEPAEWTMAVVNARDWHASWIAHPDHSLRSGPLPIFRKEIALERAPARALALLSGVGFHELRINGAKVGDAVLAPAWTNYRSTVLYETFDVTASMKQGVNAVGVLLGNGFYNVAGGRYTKYTGSFGHPRLFVQLHLEFADGTARDIGTDGSWRVQDGPVTFSCIYGGEDFDARREPAGWDRPGFDDSAWRRASTVEAPGGALRAQSSPPVRVQQTFAPARVTEPRPGIFVYDLGQNFAGWPKIEIAGAAGAQVRLTPGELLDGAGLVSQRSSGGPAYFTYTLKGSGRESWSPRFSYYGFRYVQVEGAAPESERRAGVPVLHRLEGQFLHLDAPRTGTFHCSNELFNRIHALIDAAVRSNLQHVLTDCPHREKLGWLEQSYLMGPSLLYDWDLRAWLPKVIRDTREAQTIDGLIPDIAPEYVVFGGGFRDSPEWGSAAVMLPWFAWNWYGDRRPLEESYRAMGRYVDYLDTKAEAGLLAYGLGDWYDIGPARPGVSQLTPQGVTATATWFADLNVMARAARMLGRTDDAMRFSEKAAQVREAFLKAFAGTNSQAALAMRLVLGLADGAELQERLVAGVRDKGNHTSAGDIGYHYVIRALLDGGRSDAIYDMASRTDAPSYGAQLAAGATSLTEAWDASAASSQNHLMLGHIEEWFYAGLAGIRPDFDTPGLRSVRIQPQVAGNVTSVEASWETFRGPVSVRWRIDPDAFRMSLDVPPGMTAEVTLPQRRAQQVASGHHEFEVREYRR